MHTAYHLGILQCGFQSNVFDDNIMENLNETHFMINMGNGCTLGFWSDTSVKYANVVAGGEAMTMVVQILGAVDLA